MPDFDDAGRGSSSRWRGFDDAGRGSSSRWRGSDDAGRSADARSRAFDDLTDGRRQPPTITGPGHRISGARHGRRGTEHGARRLVATVGIGAAVVLASAGSLSAYAAYDIGHGFEQNAVDVGSGSVSTDGAFNVLAVGADNDPGQGSAYGERGATLNDSNVLLHVSADHTQAVAVSLPRDLIVDQPACGGSPAVTDTPLNQAYGRGGMECVVQTVERVSGLRIPFAAQMSFQGVIEMSDAVGGVSVCVTDPVDDPYTGLRLSAGEHTVSGATALAFLRDRHGVGDGSDLSRISSLQQFLSSLVRKVKHNGTLSDPGKLYSLAKVASDTVTLSTSMAKPSTMVGMAQVFQGIGLDRITFVQYPGSVTDPRFPGKVVPDPTTAHRLMRAIAKDRPFTLDPGSTGTGSTEAAGGAVAPRSAAEPGAPTRLSAVGATTPSADAAGATTRSADAAGATTRLTAAGVAEAGGASRPHPVSARTTKPTETIPGVTGQTAEQHTCAVAAPQ